MVGNCQPSTKSTFRTKEKTHFSESDNSNNNSEHLHGIYCVDVLELGHIIPCPIVQN